MADGLLTRHIFNGFVRLHVLYHAAQVPVCGAETAEEVVRHGYRLSQGTLYPTLHQLEPLGYLRRRDEVVGGSSRYNQATAAGRRVLADARAKHPKLAVWGLALPPGPVP